MSSESNSNFSHLGNLPEGWVIVLAKNYCIRVEDGTHYTPEKTQSGKYLITSKHLLGDRLDYSTAYFISEEDFNSYNRRSKVEKWDILIGMIGAYLGGVYLEQRDEIDYTIKNVGLFKVGNELKARWLYLYLRSHLAQRHLDVIRTGSSQPFISLDAIRNFPIVVPEDSRVTQKIIETIQCLDDKIELNRRMNETLEGIAQAVWGEWFGKYASGAEELPEGWKWGTIGDMCEANKNTLSKNDSLEWVDYIEISEVNRGKIGNIVRYERGTEPSRAKRKIQHGDVILSTVRPDRGAYFFAQFPEETMIVSTGFAVFTAVIVPYCFLYVLLTQDGMLDFYGQMADGGAYPAINPSVILEKEVVIPDDQILEKYKKIADPIFEKIYRNNLQSSTLNSLRDVLLPHLMRGELFQ